MSKKALTPPPEAPMPAWYNVRADEPAPYDFESGRLQKSINLTISLQSVQDLKRIAEEIRGVATRIEYLAHFHKGEEPARVLWHVQWLVRMTNARLARIKRRGRPPAKRFRWPYGPRSSGS